MIEFVAFYIDNFAGYVDTTIEFSTNPDQPLTLIRGENQSGKTTLLRALTWTAYGRDALPPSSAGTHPVRPDWLDDGQQDHVGQLVFNFLGGDAPTMFRLTRRMVTSATGPQVKLIHEERKLERRTDGHWQDETGWEDATGQLAVLERNYFKPELREIIFADADKAEEFVGGPEQAHSDEVMERSVTEAINRLLGIEILDDAHDRVRSAQKSFRTKLRQATSSTSQLPDLQEHLHAAQTKRDALLHDLGRTFKKITQAERDIDDIRLERQKLYQNATETSGLQAEVSAKKAELATAESDFRTHLDSIIGRFHDACLPAVLMSSKIAAASDHLGDLKEAGVLPPGELSVIPRLLREGSCLCGTDCAAGTQAREELEAVLERSREHAQGRTTLDEVRISLGHLVDKAAALGDGWREMLDRRVAECAEASRTRDRLQADLSVMEEDLQELAGDAQAHRELQEQEEARQRDLKALSTSITRMEHQLGRRHVLDTAKGRVGALTTAEEHGRYGMDPLSDEVRTNGLLYEIESSQRQIAQIKRTETRASLEASQSQFADDVYEVLASVLRDIHEEQIPQVSATMNDVYQQVMQAGDESPTAEVGVMPTEHEHMDREFRLYSLNQRRQPKTIGLLSGSERRALSTAFLLALVRGADARVPFVSDSLLHAVGGVVRTNLLTRVVEDAPQSIMFAIRADLARQADRDVLERRAGRTYTITNQAHVPDKVVREATSRSGSKSVICTCGPSVYCEVCERVEDANDNDLVRTDDSALIN